MACNRPLAEKERGGDLPVRPALGDEGRNSLLGRCQPAFVCAPSDAPELVMGLLDPGGCAKPLEAAERGLERGAGCGLLPVASSSDAECEKGARMSVGIAGRLVLRDRLLEERCSPGERSLGALEQAAAARRVREHPFAAETSGVGLPHVEEPRRVVDAPEAEERLDVVARPPANARLTPPERRRLLARPAEPREALV